MINTESGLNARENQSNKTLFLKRELISRNLISTIKHQRLRCDMRIDKKNTCTNVAAAQRRPAAAAVAASVNMRCALR